MTEGNLEGAPRSRPRLIAAFPLLVVYVTGSVSGHTLLP